ncbi:MULTISPECIES: thiazole synthase [Ehrlichia]|uniref:thiazole synthase n=1 Tax=Ehrlichia cf. muris str. EmCRT TaxID=1359167 RepID=A0A0F3NFI3_9RICK|nr:MULTISPECIES: thiazole synthase [Ehrlichia]KJV65649.1 thiazole biosynthesis ThiG family protein [Ehrlichia cf. muris str. EmCRT]OUC04449.1 thiazole synthase [Ehrlichia sp. Wisconsin_h]
MLNLYDISLKSRLLLGSAMYPSPAILYESIQLSGTEVVTVSLSRQMPSENGGSDFWNIIKKSGCHILPNTAGCCTVNDAVLMSQMAREIFGTNWIKLELIGDEYTLYPDLVLLCEATKELISQGFEVFPYCTDDLVICKKLINYGCRVLMPGVAPIGSGCGVLNMYNLKLLRNRFPEITIIADAGIGRPSDAAMIMEIGFDAVLLNTAIAKSVIPQDMSRAFKYAVEAGHIAYNAGIIHKKNFAVSSTPLIDTPFWYNTSS